MTEGTPEFDATAPVELMFERPTGAEFKVDSEARTITGLAVPYGQVARNGYRSWRFRKGALRYSELSRVKIFVHHDSREAVGYVAKAEDTDAGMIITAKIGRGEDGDRALMKAADKIWDGFSIGIDFEFDDDDLGFQAGDDGVLDVYRANWRETSLTPVPAFDSARVATVKAARSREAQQEVATVPDDKTAELESAPVAVDFSKLTEAIQAGHAETTEAFKTALAEVLEKFAKPADERADSPKASGIEVTREAPVYMLDGSGASFVKDAWNARMDGDRDAQERLRKYAQQTDDNARRAYFAAGTTSNLSEIIPPGYRPDLYVAELPQGRPLVESLSRGSLSNATPFTIPKFVSASGLAGDHTEGVAPSVGTVTVGEVTVTPKAKSGKFQLSREIVDAANPAVDAIALAAMREAYIQNTEAEVATLLETAAGTDTNSDGISDAGVYLDAVTGEGRDFILQVRASMADYPFRRFAAANRLVLAQPGYTAAVTAVDDVSRPLLPSIGAQNAFGVASAAVQALSFDGVPGLPAWALDGNEQDAYLFNSVDVWAWESSLLTFRFEEKVGPEKIELAIFGYFATQIIRPSGVTAISYTAG